VSETQQCGRGYGTQAAVRSLPELFTKRVRVSDGCDGCGGWHVHGVGIADKVLERAGAVVRIRDVGALDALDGGTNHGSHQERILAELQFESIMRERARDWWHICLCVQSYGLVDAGPERLHAEVGDWIKVPRYRCDTASV